MKGKKRSSFSFHDFSYWILCSLREKDTYRQIQHTFTCKHHFDKSLAGRLGNKLTDVGTFPQQTFI